MKRITNVMKDVENHYYKQLEWYRLYGVDIERIENQLSEQLNSRVDFTFLYPDKRLMRTLFNSENSATEVYTALETITDNIEVRKIPEDNEVKFVAKTEVFEIHLTLYLSFNKRCWYEEVGTKEVPVYELKCEENE